MNMKKAYNHGGQFSSEYESWSNMKARCNNPNNHKYYLYGARGIKVCERWNNDFKAFIDDMGEKPTREYTLDRIDGDKGYSPENCRWATKREQSENRPHFNRMITYEGKTQSMSAWAREYHINREALKYRLNSGWSIEESLKTPKLKSPKDSRVLYKGEMRSKVSLAREYNVPLARLKKRLKNGWDVESAIITPSLR